jgi:putative ABC transport system substrate-binding protein
MLAKYLSLLLATLSLMTVCAADAQQPERVYRIGYLAARNHPTPTAPDSNLDSFRDGMRDLGYVLGKNLVIEARFADGSNAHLAVLATQLVQLNVDIIVSTAIQPSLAAKEATSTIPVVFAGAGDPVAWALVKSLARPGGNVTGVTNFSPELSGKRVELLKEAIPRISRIAVLRDSRQPPQSFNETEKAARSLGIALQ